QTAGTNIGWRLRPQAPQYQPYGGNGIHQPYQPGVRSRGPANKVDRDSYQNRRQHTDDAIFRDLVEQNDPQPQEDSVPQNEPNAQKPGSAKLVQNAFARRHILVEKVALQHRGDRQRAPEFHRWVAEEIEIGLVDVPVELEASRVIQISQRV